MRMGRTLFRSPPALAACWAHLFARPFVAPHAGEDMEVTHSPPPRLPHAGEEMTHYCMELILKDWVNPFVDTSKWEYFDCSCKNRDATDDKVGGGWTGEARQTSSWKGGGGATTRQGGQVQGVGTWCPSRTLNAHLRSPPLSFHTVCLPDTGTVSGHNVSG